mgnify:CR=1 FL=1|jgi:hypothetical protein
MDDIFGPYHVYVQTDEHGRIIAVNSSAFVPESWGTEIDQGWGDKHHHAQGNYLPQPVYTDDGIPRYKLADGQAQERTEEEIEADRALIPPPPPSLAERVEALEESGGAAVWDEMAAALREGVNEV